MSLLDRLVKEDKMGLHIGGEWRTASDGRTIDVVDPATEELIAAVASASPTDGVAAAAVAYEAANSWAKTAPRERGEILRRAFELMIEEGEDLARLITLENGKALADARGEIAYGAEFLRWFSEEAVRNYGDIYRSPAGDKNIVIVHQPVGVSLLITPWNFPLSMATRKIGPALAAGCTVVWKPASDTPLVALAVADVMERAGAPAGVVNVIPADRSSEVVTAIMADERVRKLSFTGSTEVGRVLLAEASKRVLNTSMELGGNAPFLVLPQADVAAAVAGAMQAKMRNAGEACTAANRFYVHRSLADEFSSRLSDAMGSLKIGPGLDETTDVGPLINRSTRLKVSGLVDEAAEWNARILTGGKEGPGRGFFYEPTVLADVDPDAPILREEIFGPVAPIVAFDDVDSVIEMANDTEYGLISYVYAGNAGEAIAVAERLDAGMIAVNRGLVSDPAAPFGGIKQSGLGREGSRYGMLEYLETKYIGADW